MTKSFTTHTKLNGSEPLLRNMVCEVRYQDGYLYLDHCGRLLKKLVGDGSEWIAGTDPTPQGATAFNILAGTQLRVNQKAAALSLDKSSTDEVIDTDEVACFIKQVADVLEMAFDELEATEISRLGYREMHYFSFDSKEESEKWLQDLGLFSVSSCLLDSFQARQEALGISLVVQGKDCQYRIAMNGLERAAQIPVGDSSVNIRTTAASAKQKKALLEAMKRQRQRQINSAFSVVLDIDAFLLHPAECDLASFVQERTATNLQMFRDAVAKANKKGKSS